MADGSGETASASALTQVLRVQNNINTVRYGVTVFITYLYNALLLVAVLKQLNREYRIVSFGIFITFEYLRNRLGTIQYNRTVVKA